MLRSIGKVFEKNISKLLINYINDINLFYVYQSAYKKGYIARSIYTTEHSLLTTMNNIYLSFINITVFNY